MRYVEVLGEALANASGDFQTEQRTSRQFQEKRAADGDLVDSATKTAGEELYLQFVSLLNT